MNALHYRHAITKIESEQSNLYLDKVYQRRAEQVLGDKLMEILREATHPIVCKLETESNDGYEYAEPVKVVDTVIHLDEVKIVGHQQVVMPADIYHLRRPLVVYHDRPPRVVEKIVKVSPPSLWSRIRSSVAESWAEAESFGKVGVSHG